MEDDIAEQLARRDNFRRKLWQQKTPDERVAAMEQIQQAMWDAFARSPEGYAHFLRRNYKARAIDVSKFQ